MSVPVLAVVSMPDVNGLPDDTVVNTFAFAPSSTAAGPLGDIVGSLTGFYNQITGAGFRVSAFLSPDLDRGVDKCLIDFYDLTGHLDGSAHGSPIESATWTLGAVDGAEVAQPRQLAVAMSFHGDFGSLAEVVPGGPAGPAGDAHPKARRRGRVYLGPLAGVGISRAAGVRHAIASPNFVSAIHDAQVRLMGGTQPWVVWSRKEVNVFPVTGGWVDNRIDTIRRRTTAATSRTTF